MNVESGFFPGRILLRLTGHGVLSPSGGRTPEIPSECPSYHRLEKLNMDLAHTDIDWLACDLIEQIPGKVSGRPIVRGTRILPHAIVNSYDAGETIDEIHENYPGLTIFQIQRLIEFAHSTRRQAAS